MPLFNSQYFNTRAPQFLKELSFEINKMFCNYNTARGNCFKKQENAKKHLQWLLWQKIQYKCKILPHVVLVEIMLPGMWVYSNLLEQSEFLQINTVSWEPRHGCMRAGIIWEGSDTAAYQWEDSRSVKTKQIASTVGQRDWGFNNAGVTALPAMWSGWWGTVFFITGIGSAWLILHFVAICAMHDNVLGLL